MVVSIQPATLAASPTSETTGGPHASVAVTLEIFGAGTAALHPGRLTVAGHVMDGGAESIVRVMICEQVAVFPHPSIAI